MMHDIKTEFQKRYPLLQLFYYEPTFPRKHLTILLVGPWEIITLAKAELE
jgi:hypothetical protein